MTKHKAHPKKAVDAQATAGPAAPADRVQPAVPSEGSVQPETPSVPSAPGAALVEPEPQAIQRLSEELEQIKDRHLRLAAEFDNFRKRTQRERAEAGSRAQADLAASILDGLDDLGRVGHLDAQTTPARDVLAGVELVERKLAGVLAAAGLERVGTEGERFDPNVHEAVTSVPAPTVEQDHRVASIMQPGYRFAGQLLRPARVSVYLWQEPVPTDGPQPGS